MNIFLTALLQISTVVANPPPLTGRSSKFRIHAHNTASTNVIANQSSNSNSTRVFEIEDASAHANVKNEHASGLSSAIELHSGSTSDVSTLFDTDTDASMWSREQLVSQVRNVINQNSQGDLAIELAAVFEKTFAERIESEIYSALVHITKMSNQTSADGRSKV